MSRESSLETSNQSFEQRHSLNRLGLALAFGAVALLPAGCSALTSGPKLAPCYDTLQPADVFPEYPEHDNADPITVPKSEVYPATADGTAATQKAFDDYKQRLAASMQPYYDELAQYNALISPAAIPLTLLDGAYRVAEMPTIDPPAKLAVEAATVLITDPEGYGTGFIARNNAGIELVVTAGHVVRDQNMDDLVVTTSEGVEFGVVGGCVISEETDDGVERLSKDGEEIIEADVAVLRLDSPTNIAPLTVSKTQPARGDWVWANNYQIAPNLSNPSQFNVLVTQSLSGTKSATVLDGLEVNYNDTTGLYADDSLEPGGSGGPVIDSHGDVAGIAVSSMLSNLYVGTQELKTSNQIDMTEIANDLLRPATARIMKPLLLQAALESPVAVMVPKK